jgi:hypothetical protein
MEREQNRPFHRFEMAYDGRSFTFEESSLTARRLQPCPRFDSGDIFEALRQ